MKKKITSLGNMYSFGQSLKKISPGPSLRSLTATTPITSGVFEALLKTRILRLLESHFGSLVSL